MNKISLFVITTIFLLAFTAGIVSASTNLILNSGFENGLDNWHKTGWFSPLSPSQSIDSTDSHSGSNSLKLSVTGVNPNPIADPCTSTGQRIDKAGVVAVDYSTIALQPNTKYELISWVKVNQDSIDSGYKYSARTRLHLYNTENRLQENLANQSYPNCGAGFGPDKVEVLNFFHTEAKKGEWVKITETFTTDSEHVYAHLWLIADASIVINTPETPAIKTFNVWFDDVSLKEITTEKHTHKNNNNVNTIIGCTVGECVNPDNYNPQKATLVIVSDESTQGTINLTSTGTTTQGFFTRLYNGILNHAILLWLSIGILVILLLVIMILLLR
jgi:hypothetical protein